MHQPLSAEAALAAQDAARKRAAAAVLKASSNLMVPNGGKDIDNGANNNRGLKNIDTMLALQEDETPVLPTVRL